MTSFEKKKEKFSFCWLSANSKRVKRQPLSLNFTGWCLAVLSSLDTGSVLRHLLVVNLVSLTFTGNSVWHLVVRPQYWLSATPSPNGEVGSAWPSLEKVFGTLLSSLDAGSVLCHLLVVKLDWTFRSSDDDTKHRECLHVQGPSAVVDQKEKVQFSQLLWQTDSPERAKITWLIDIPHHMTTELVNTEHYGPDHMTAELVNTEHYGPDHMTAELVNTEHYGPDHMTAELVKAWTLWSRSHDSWISEHITLWSRSHDSWISEHITLWSTSHDSWISEHRTLWSRSHDSWISEHITLWSRSHDSWISQGMNTMVQITWQLN